MKRAQTIFGLVTLSFVGFGLLHCSDDSTPAPATTPAPTATADTGAPDAAKFTPPPGEVINTDGAAALPIPSTRKWRPTVITLNLQPQPSPKTGAPGGDPGFTLPFVLAQNQKGVPARTPDALQDSQVIPGSGLGCIAYKFSSLNPADPTGPNLPDGDMGSVTLNGFTGGDYVYAPDAGPVPKPITCQRKEVPVTGSGFFLYQCPEPAPASGFLKPTDQLTVTVAGGADLPAWTATSTPSGNDDLVVTTDLWSFTHEMLNGESDVTFQYNCGGGPCNKAALITVNIETTDGDTFTPDAGLDAAAADNNPYRFPNKKKEFGVINCIDFLYGAGHPNTFTLSKDLFKQIPGSWTDARLIVGTVNLAQAQLEGQPTVFAPGFARIGFSHHR